MGAAADVHGREVGPSVAVCVATFRRPQLLSRALESLRNLRLDRTPQARVRVCIADNDREGTGQSVVEAARETFPWPIDYAIEPQRGISFARNRLVAMAGGADFVAFMDDDESAEPRWLDELLAVQRATNADVVRGPVLSEWEETPPAWMVFALPFRSRHRTGSRVQRFYTNNCLIRGDLLRGEEGPFDPAFALTGGEDVHLSERLAARGAAFFWADDALVRERLPKSRLTVSWVLRRRFREGTSAGMLARRLPPRLRRIPLRLAKGVANAALGILLVVPALCLGRKGLLWCASRVAKGCGSLLGLLEVRCEEYRSVHGR